MDVEGWIVMLANYYPEPIKAAALNAFGAIEDLYRVVSKLEALAEVEASK